MSANDMQEVKNETLRPKYVTGETVAVLRCLRCGHEWVPRLRNQLPLVCSRCRSPYYGKERVRKKSAKIK